MVGVKYKDIHCESLMMWELDRFIVAAVTSVTSLPPGPASHAPQQQRTTSHFSLLSPPTTKLKLSKNRILNCQLFKLMYFTQAGSSLLTMETKQKMSDMEMLISDNTQCSALFTTFHINGRGASVECRRWRSPARAYSWLGRETMKCHIITKHIYHMKVELWVES